MVNSGFERCPLWVMMMMGVDVAVEVEKQRCGAYISVCVFMVVSAARAQCVAPSSTTPHRVCPCTVALFNSNLIVFFQIIPPLRPMLTRPPKNSLLACSLLGYCVNRATLCPAMDKLDVAMPHAQACSTLHTWEAYARRSIYN
jgi:hypothetical protein